MPRHLLNNDKCIKMKLKMILTFSKKREFVCFWIEVTSFIFGYEFSQKFTLNTNCGVLIVPTHNSWPLIHNELSERSGNAQISKRGFLQHIFRRQWKLAREAKYTERLVRIIMFCPILTLFPSTSSDSERKT